MGMQKMAEDLATATSDVRLVYQDKGRGKMMTRQIRNENLERSITQDGWALGLGGLFTLLYMIFVWNSIFMPIIAATISVTSTMITLGLCRLFFGRFVSTLEWVALLLCMVYGNNNMYMITSAFDRSEYQPEL